MDKNMINIDDLVRLRLTGGEEKERPGAWLQMKDLLDKEMPVRVAVGYNWRRAFTAAALLLLVGSATIGSYKFYTNNKANNGGDGVRPVTNTTVVEGGASSGHIVSSEKEGVASSNGGKQNNPATVVVTNTNTEKANGQKTSNKNTDNHLVTTHTATATSSKKVSVHTATNDANEAAKNNIAVDNSVKNNKKTHTNNTYASGSKLPKDVLKNTKPGVGNVSGDESKVAKGKKGSHKAAAPTNTVPSNPTPPVYNYGGATAPVTASTPAPQKQPVDFRKSNPRYVDSANYTYVREVVNRGTYRMDTIDKGIMAMNREGLASGTEVNTNPQAAPENSNVNPNAAPPAKEDKLTRAERRAERKRYVQSSLWEKMVANAKPNFTDVSLHPGLMLGLSSTSGQYHMMGVQGGFAAKLNLSERWGILSELKLLYRFGNGKSFDNNYNALNGDRQYIPGSGSSYLYRVDSQEHSFNITSAGLVELPIAIRYSISKLNFFAGANFAYNFPVNVEERFGKVYTREVIGGVNTGEQMTEDWKNNRDPKLTPEEFGSRFSMGYLLGVGYQVTPKIGLDMRASQVFWDNGKVHSTGAYLVSKEMYRAPCFQFNFTYRLQGNRNGPMKAR